MDKLAYQHGAEGTAGMGLNIPQDIELQQRDDGAYLVYKGTDEQVPIVRRSAVLPWSWTPDGSWTWTMPAALDLLPLRGVRVPQAVRGAIEVAPLAKGASEAAAARGVSKGGLKSSWGVASSAQNTSHAAAAVPKAGQLEEALKGSFARTSGAYDEISATAPQMAARNMMRPQSEFLQVGAKNNRWQDAPYGRSEFQRGAQSHVEDAHSAAKTAQQAIEKFDRAPSLEPLTLRRGAKDSLSSYNVKIYDPPPLPPRPFEHDYTSLSHVAKRGKKLTVDMDDRILSAKYIAGRRRSGGADFPIPFSEHSNLIKRIINSKPKAVSRDRLQPRSIGAYYPLGRPDGPAVRYLRDLSPRAAERVIAHEIGHIIDQYSGYRIRQPHIEIELYQNYDNLLLGRRHPYNVPGPYMGPESRGYTAKMIWPELVAEAIRAYMTNPNYFKATAPNAAAEIRQAVNRHPKLSKVIQFNTSTPAGSIAGAIGREFEHGPAGQYNNPSTQTIP
ncbi:hypothetical protein [Chelatococcus reniformis]|nr:hypothetical protein [Chelatococcus reniformis]